MQRSVSILWVVARSCIVACHFFNTQTYTSSHNPLRYTYIYRGFQDHTIFLRRNAQAETYIYKYIGPKGDHQCLAIRRQHHLDIQPLGVTTRSITVPVLLLVGIVRVHFLYLNPKICKYQIFSTDILYSSCRKRYAYQRFQVQKVYPPHRRNWYCVPKPRIRYYLWGLGTLCVPNNADYTCSCVI